MLCRVVRLWCVVKTAWADSEVCGRIHRFVFLLPYVYGSSRITYFYNRINTIICTFEKWNNAFLFHSVILLNSSKCLLQTLQHARYLLDGWELWGRTRGNEVSEMVIRQALPSKCSHARRRQRRKSLITVQKECTTCISFPGQSHHGTSALGTGPGTKWALRRGLLRCWRNRLLRGRHTL